MIPKKIIRLDNIPCMYIKVETFPTGIDKAFKKLESHFKSLKGKKFYGVLKNDGDNYGYYACVKIDSSLDTEIYKLPEYTIPGGSYASAKLDDWRNNLQKIKEIHKELSTNFEEDETRPFIEYYKSYKELVLYFPVKK
ncbi:MAG: hypothetical protein EHM58_13110 [Ignavibacteriae bacterium]|nr:MAG: hypothetical protein EHM58_13110 [Ignavibacteriota bacterium]